MTDWRQHLLDQPGLSDEARARLVPGHDSVEAEPVDVPVPAEPVEPVSARPVQVRIDDPGPVPRDIGSDLAIDTLSGLARLGLTAIWTDPWEGAQLWSRVKACTTPKPSLELFEDHTVGFVAGGITVRWNPRPRF